MPDETSEVGLALPIKATEKGQIELPIPEDLKIQILQEVQRHLSSDVAISLEYEFAETLLPQVLSQLRQGTRLVVVNNPRENMCIAVSISNGDSHVSRLYPMLHNPDSLGPDAKDIGITWLYWSNAFLRLPPFRNAPYLQRVILSNNPKENVNYRPINAG